MAFTPSSTIWVPQIYHTSHKPCYHQQCMCILFWSIALEKVDRNLKNSKELLQICKNVFMLVWGSFWLFQNRVKWEMGTHLQDMFWHSKHPPTACGFNILVIIFCRYERRRQLLFIVYFLLYNYLAFNYNNFQCFYLYFLFSVFSVTWVRLCWIFQVFSTLLDITSIFWFKTEYIKWVLSSNLQQCTIIQVLFLYIRNWFWLLRQTLYSTNVLCVFCSVLCHSILYHYIVAQLINFTSFSLCQLCV